MLRPVNSCRRTAEPSCPSDNPASATTPKPSPTRPPSSSGKALQPARQGIRQPPEPSPPQPLIHNNPIKNISDSTRAHQAKPFEHAGRAFHNQPTSPGGLSKPFHAKAVRGLEGRSSSLHDARWSGSSNPSHATPSRQPAESHPSANSSHLNKAEKPASKSSDNFSLHFLFF